MIKEVNRWFMDLRKKKRAKSHFLVPHGIMVTNPIQKQCNCVTLTKLKRLNTYKILLQNMKLTLKRETHFQEYIYDCK